MQREGDVSCLMKHTTTARNCNLLCLGSQQDIMPLLVHPQIFPSNLHQLLMVASNVGLVNQELHVRESSCNGPTTFTDDVGSGNGAIGTAPAEYSCDFNNSSFSYKPHSFRLLPNPFSDKLLSSMMIGNPPDLNCSYLLGSSSPADPSYKNQLLSSANDIGAIPTEADRNFEKKIASWNDLQNTKVVEHILKNLPFIFLNEMVGMSTRFREEAHLSLRMYPRPSMFLVHRQLFPSPHLSITAAFDPDTQSWTALPLTFPAPYKPTPIQSSQPGLLYLLDNSSSPSTTALKIAENPLLPGWKYPGNIQNWRRNDENIIVAIVGSWVIVAGGRQHPWYGGKPKMIEVFVKGEERGHSRVVDPFPDSFTEEYNHISRCYYTSSTHFFMISPRRSTYTALNVESGHWSAETHLPLPQSANVSFAGLAGDRLFILATWPAGDSTNSDQGRKHIGVFDLMCDAATGYPRGDGVRLLGEMTETMVEEVVDLRVMSRWGEDVIRMAGDYIFFCQPDQAWTVFYFNTSTMEWARTDNPVGLGPDPRPEIIASAFSCIEVGVDTVSHFHGRLSFPRKTFSRDHIVTTLTNFTAAVGGDHRPITRTS